MTQDQLENLIVGWGTQKGILPHPIPEAQFSKTLEEVRELQDALEEGDIEGIRDSIGDIYVTLVMQTRAHGLTMNECIRTAWEEISQRTGKMVNGVFVKDES